MPTDTDLPSSLDAPPDVSADPPAPELPAPELPAPEPPVPPVMTQQEQEQEQAVQGDVYKTWTCCHIPHWKSEHKKHLEVSHQSYTRITVAGMWSS